MKKYIYTAVWIIVTALIFYKSRLISDATYITVLQTAKSILPILFPYSIMASLMVSLGINSVLCKILPVSKVFMLPDIASPAILTGAICGFPLGTKVVCEMFENKQCTKEEAEIIISVSAFASPAFVINVIGKIYFKSTEIGILIYASHLISTVLSSILINGKYKSNTKRFYTPMPLGAAISRAIESAVISSLYVCGYITVFSVIINALGDIPIEIKCTIASLLEFSSASRYSAEISSNSGMFLAAFAVGWSGLSVLFQTMSMSAPLKLSLNKYIKVKLLSGVLCGFFTVAYFAKRRYALALISGLVASLAIASHKRPAHLTQIVRKSI